MGFSSCRIFLLLSLLLLFIVSLLYFLFCVPVISNELQLRIKEIDIVRGYSRTIYMFQKLSKECGIFMQIYVVRVTMKINFRLLSRCKWYFLLLGCYAA